MEQKTITAKLNDFRQSPRKMRLVASLLKGKNAERALVELSLLPKKSSAPLTKLIKSALANAKSQNVTADTLYIKRLSVDGGAILYRRRFRARGRVVPIRKRTSKVILVLGEKTVSIKNKKPIKS
ncbi:MAG: 50S ribosomal protein L22 [Patescibacteria group bacterium]